ncbi:DegV family protein [Calorimonas adulescens]|jgi:EDD domain protein, DegV family|uniref:DegV family protein n=1 Tax=Calorimonas adulescens TaxID=2606906 RepID=A0A5D8QFH2_9THEO|nr:DegV family protein [Calorimonas adulescens]TZE82576.1 DegV family protein [Calorimonas adulescens]
MGICIVTDSCSDLPKWVIDKYKIVVAPLTVHFGDMSYRDGVDISSAEFYEILSNTKVMPTTSMVTPGYFKELFNGLINRYDSIIGLFFSSKLSGTYNSAVTAKGEFPDADITVIDTLNATLGQGLIVLKAARMAEEGASKDEIIGEVHRMMANIKYALVFSDLGYLHRGGRLSTAQTVVGNILNIKPILGIEDGEIKVIERVRGKKKAFKWIVDYIKSFNVDLSSKTIGINHSNSPEDADELEKIIKENFSVGEIIKSQAGAVIGTHAGPDAVGIYFERE